MPPGLHAGDGSVTVGMQYSRVASQYGGSRKFTTGASTWNVCPAMMMLPLGLTIGSSLCQVPQLRRADPDRGAVLEVGLGDPHAVDVGAVGRAAIVDLAGSGR